MARLSDQLEQIEQILTHQEPTPAKLLAALQRLKELQKELATWEPELIAAARKNGVSWAILAPVLGVTSRQAAERRYLRLAPGAPNTTAEQRVQHVRSQRAQHRATVVWARENAAMLRQLAGQISGLSGMSTQAQHSVKKVRQALGSDDITALLIPLMEVQAHIRQEHPELARRITIVVNHHH